MPVVTEDEFNLLMRERDEKEKDVCHIATDWFDSIFFVCLSVVLPQLCNIHFFLDNEYEKVTKHERLRVIL